MRAKGKRIGIAAAAVLLLATAPAANAVLMIQLSSGGDTQTVVDGGAGDAVGLEGLVTFAGSVGGFFINLSSGVSKPILGSPWVKALDLASLNISGGTAGTITIRLTDTDFIDPSGLLPTTTLIGGTTDGAVSLASYLDSSNTAFGTGTLLAAMDFGAGAFSGSSFSQLNTGSPYSLTLVATITHSGYGITSFDAITRVPEPGTLFLLGIGLLGLGLTRKYFTKGFSA